MKDMGQEASITPQQKREMLRKLLELKSKSKVTFPLSKGQSAMWFIYNLEPDSHAYHILFSGRIVSPLRVDALLAAIQQLSRRHEALRTTFSMDRDGFPVQVVHPSLDTPVYRSDVIGKSESEIYDFVLQDSRKPFDLENQPPARFHLYHKEKETILLFVNHHIVSDYWSLSVLIDDLSSLYGDNDDQTTSSLPKLSATFESFVQQQSELLNSPEGDMKLDYWKSALAGGLPLLELPIDYPRPKKQTYNGNSMRFMIDDTTVERIDRVASQCGVTSFTVLLAIYFVFLCRYTSQNEIVVGIPTAGRHSAAFEDIVGYFSNPIAIRTANIDTMTVRTLIDHIKDNVFQAMNHQDIPFSVVVDSAGIQRDSSRTPIFQSMFAYQRAPRLEEQQFSKFMIGDSDTVLRLGNLEFRSYPLPQQEGQFDLSLSVIKDGRYLQGAFLYNTDLFSSGKIERVSKNFVILVESALLNLNAPISHLPVIAPEEEQLLLKDNDRIEQNLTHHTLIEHIDRIAASTPDHIAVSCGRESITYKELVQRSSKLARQLWTHGVQVGTAVGLFAERSIDTVIGALGIWRAGALYVPLDKSYPEERLAYIAQDSNINLIVNSSPMSADWHSDIPHMQIEINDIAYESIILPPIPDTAIAYILYTSGSTGRPKGVVVKHRQLLHHILAIAECYEIKSHDSVLQFSSFNFDTSIEQILVPLLHGARLVLRDEELWSPSQYLERAAMEKISVSNLPTAYWFRLVDEWHRNHIELPSTLRLFIVGGEAMLPHHLKAWNSLNIGSCRLFNVYGPTETIITSHRFEIIHGAEWASDKSIPIGTAICGRASYVLDENQQLVPLGVPGELYIGGYSLADGYWNQKQLSDEKFIKNPFHHGPDQRMYRTGDLVRLLEDGNLEFLGRRDKQVKIRGFRIEVEEIESVLARHPAIRECVVVVKEPEPGNKKLVAYFLSSEGVHVSRTDFEQLISRKLPAYCIPSMFISLEELPLTPNGKVDRALLAQLEIPQELPLHRAEGTPMSTVEIELAAIWSTLLKCTPVGINDNFFELGGDSITGLQMIMLAGQRGMKLDPKHIFQHQTIAELAKAVVIVERLEQHEELPLEGPMPLTPIQRWFFEQNYPNRGHYNQTALLYFMKHANPHLLEKAINFLCEHHDALRINYREIDGEWIQSQQNNLLPILLNVYELPDEDANSLSQYIDNIATNLQQSMDLQKGNTFLAAYFKGNSAHPSCLLLIIHHLLVDGVSWRILLNDLQTSYQQLENEAELSLPPRTTSFQRWAQQLTEYAHGEAILQELDYWKSATNDAPPSFPLDFSFGSNIEKSSRRVHCSLTEEETTLLLTHAPKDYRSTMNEILIAAFQLAYSAWSGNEQLLIDLESHGREMLFDNMNITRTTGWFTSIYPIFLENQGAEFLGESIKHVKMKLRQVPNNGIGFGILSYLTSDAQVSSSLKMIPKAPVCFNYLGQLDTYSTSQPLFYMKQLNSGLPRDPESVRSHIIQIDCAVIGGKMQINFTYSSNLHLEESIASLSRQYKSFLVQAASQAQKHASESFVPSDFPLARLNPLQLDTLTKTYGNIEEIYRLSPMQSGMLFHSLLHTDSAPPYIAQFNCTIQGSLDPKTLEMAWSFLKSHHAVLRTAYVWNGVDEPLQIVCTADSSPVRWTILDWSAYPSEMAQEKLNELLEKDRTTPFHLTEPSPMRFIFIKLGGGRIHFAWTHHHILLDGWSLAILLKQSFAAYQSLFLGTTIEIQTGPAYKQYIQWISEKTTDEAERFWKNYLKGFHTPVVLEKRKTNEIEQALWSEKEWTLDGHKTKKLKLTSTRFQVTVNMMIQSVWAMLLHHYSGNTDIVFGATTSGRPSEIAGIEHAVGLFINTLPMRAIIEPDLPIGIWLEQLQEQSAEARSFESSPLILIQQWSEVPRGTELFDSIVVFENYPVDRNEILGPDLKLERASSYVQLNYSLALEVTPGEQLVFKIEYDSGSYDHDFIDDIEQNFNKLVNRITEFPDSTINALLLHLRHRMDETNNKKSIFSTL